MPIIIPKELPAAAILKHNIFALQQERAIKQEIRPLKIAIVNLMPQKSLQKINCCSFCPKVLCKSK